MQDDSQLPLTKEDGKFLLQELKKIYDRLDQTVTKEELKQELQDTRAYVDEKAEETKRHFDVVAEDMRHDYAGAHKDRMQSHEDRIVRLEQHVGIAA